MLKKYIKFLLSVILIMLILYIIICIYFGCEVTNTIKEIDKSDTYNEKFIPFVDEENFIDLKFFHDKKYYSQNELNEIKFENLDIKEIKCIWFFNKLHYTITYTDKVYKKDNSLMCGGNYTKFITLERIDGNWKVAYICIPVSPKQYKKHWK